MDQPDLQPLEDAARAELDDKYAARERALLLSRKTIRSSANAIRSLHRGELAEAERLMDEAAALVTEAASMLADHGDVRYAGFVDDAAKEYAEARTTYALALGRPIPLPADLGVGVTPYLNGLGEAVGELRRRCLTCCAANSSTRRNRPSSRWRPFTGCWPASTIPMG